IDRGNGPHLHPNRSGASGCRVSATETGKVWVPEMQPGGPVGPSVGQRTCVSRPEATGRLYHSRQYRLALSNIARGVSRPEQRKASSYDVYVCDTVSSPGTCRPGDSYWC